MTRFQRARATAERFGRWADGLRTWFERHWKVALVLLVLFSATATIQSYRTSRDESAHARAQAAAAKRESAANEKRINTLFDQRDQRRRVADRKRYKASLTACRQQNIARRGTNDIARILQDAFAPVIAAEKRGVKETPLVHGLARAAAKLTILPIVICVNVVPNPDKPGHQ